MITVEIREASGEGIRVVAVPIAAEVLEAAEASHADAATLGGYIANVWRQLRDQPEGK
jgi:hypothetical protein